MICLIIEGFGNTFADENDDLIPGDEYLIWGGGVSIRANPDKDDIWILYRQIKGKHMYDGPTVSIDRCYLTILGCPAGPHTVEEYFQLFRQSGGECVV